MQQNIKCKIDIEVSAVKKDGSEEVPTTNTYESGSSFDINNYWTNNNVADYTVNEEQWVTTISWNKTDQWAAFKTTAEGIDDEFNILRFTVRGTAGQTILVKPNNSMEYPIVLSENDTTYYIPVPNGLTELYIIGNPYFAEVGAEGQCVISQATLIYASDATTDFAAELVDGGDGVYANAEGLVTLDKAGQEWASIYANLKPVSGEEYKVVLKMTISDIEGATALKIIAKLNNNNAYQIEKDLEAGTYEWELTAGTDDITEFRMFVGAMQQNIKCKIDIEVNVVAK